MIPKVGFRISTFAKDVASLTACLIFLVSNIGMRQNMIINPF